MANSVVLTRLRETVVDIDLAACSREAVPAVAFKSVNLVQAESPVQAGRVRALIDVDLALGAGKAGHAHATEGSRVVQAASVVVARMRFALVHVRLATWPGESLRAVAGERSRSVDADSIVLARGSLFALVNVLGAVGAFVARGTGAREGAIDRTRVTNGVRVAGIRSASIVQVAQQSRLSRCATAHETAHTVDAGRAIEAGRTVAVVDVNAAIGAGPAVYANARVAADRIRAGRSVLTHRGSVENSKSWSYNYYCAF